MKIDDENARKLEKARILPDEDETEHKSCFGRCRRSLHMSTALGFTILFLDAMLLTALGMFQKLSFEFKFHNFSSNSMNSLNCIYSDVSMK